MYYRGAIRAQSLAAPVILSVLNVHVILLFQTNKPDDDDDDITGRRSLVCQMLANF